MPWYRMPDGTGAHLKMSGPRAKWPKHCQAPWDATPNNWCACMAELQCAWKLPRGATCSKWLCKAHALEVAPGKHLCPDHQKAYAEWMAKRNAT
jgi:hypothetical protein